MVTIQGDRDGVYDKNETDDAGDDTRKELFLNQPGSKDLDMELYGETDPIKADKTIIENKTSMGQQDLIPTIPKKTKKTKISNL